MKYYVTRETTRKGCTQGENLLVTEDIDRAKKEARYWHKRKEAGEIIEIRVYAHDIEDDDCSCFDYDTVNYLTEWMLPCEDI